MKMQFLLLFFAVLIEGPIATLTAAAIAGHNPHFDITAVFIVSMLGNLTADICWFMLGTAGKHAKILNYIPWLKNQGALVERAGAEIQKKGIKLFVLTKLGFGIGTIPLLIAAGMLKVNRRQLFSAAVLTELVWTGTLVIVGNAAGSNFDRIIHFFEYSLPWITAAILLILFFQVCIKFCKKI
jgi:membrane protein DedA with SNARE-associated domain